MNDDPFRELDQDTFESLRKAVFGKITDRACEFMSLCVLLEKLHSSSNPISSSPAAKELMLANARIVMAHLMEATRSRDTKFFSEVASAFHAYFTEGVAHLVKGWLLNEKDRLIESPLTAMRLQELVASKTGNKVDERQLRRLCEEIGIPLVKAQEGRPKGKKNKPR